MIYDIANLKVEIKNENGRTEKQAIPYLAQNQDEKNIDITIDVDEKRVLQAMKEHPELVQDDWEYMLTGSDFYTELIKYNGILLHSSCVVVDDYAYGGTEQFSDLLHYKCLYSGTGKYSGIKYRNKLWI